MDANNSTKSGDLSFCTEPTKPTFILYTVFFVLIMLATIFGNLLVITAVYLYHRLRRMTNFFIISLAVSDLCVVLGHLPLRIVNSVHNGNWCFDQEEGDVTTCAYWIVMDTVFSSASICNLVIISVDRFLAITKPFEYQSRMTKRVGFSLIAFVWVYAMLWGVLSLVNWSGGSQTNIQITSTEARSCRKSDKIYYATAMAVALFLPLLIVIITYSFVFRVAFTQAKAVASLDPNKGKRRILRELKATKTIAIVIGVFIVCWLPAFMLIVMSLWCEVCLEPLKKNPTLAQAINIPFVDVLPIMNSSLNPLIYTVFNKEFRAAFSRMLCRRGEASRSNALDEVSVTEATHFGTSADSRRNSRLKSWIRMKSKAKQSS